MKIEDLSKDELIHLIGVRYVFDINDIEYDVLAYRAEKCFNKLIQYSKEANNLLCGYIELLKPYYGKTDIPYEILKKGSEILRQRDLYLKKERIKRTEYRKIQILIDEVLSK